MLLTMKGRQRVEVIQALIDSRLSVARAVESLTYYFETKPPARL
jgi:hypothetical protein